MIWDCVTLNDELDMLECRLTELAGVVDRFVVAEADTVQGDGRPKPLWLAENWARFRPWWGQLVHVVVTRLPGGPDPWERERQQREHLMIGLEGVSTGEDAAAPDDLVLFGDVDEIPSPGGVMEAAARQAPSVFMQRLAFFAVDWVAPWPWPGTVAARRKDVTSMTELRAARGGYQPIKGGWHLSWLGGPGGVAAKLADRCHTDETAKITALNDAGELWQRGVVWQTPWDHLPYQLTPAEVDDSWPRWVAARRCPDVWFRPRHG